MLIKNDADFLRILRGQPTIAMVGLSANPERPSHAVASYLINHGYRIIPVNPAETEILGQKCYPSLSAIPQPIDIVDCFRKAADIPPIAEEAIKVGAKVLWMQLGVVNVAAAERANAAGLDVVMDRCVEIEHARLLG